VKVIFGHSSTLDPIMGAYDVPLQDLVNWIEWYPSHCSNWCLWCHQRSDNVV